MNDPYAARREKLVRDRIPELIRADGTEPRVRRAAPEELTDLLLAKLYEEADEFAADPSEEELADLLEVVHGLASRLGHSWDELERVRQEKALARGGFTQGYVLGIHEPRQRPLVQKSRALLLDGDELVLFRRTRPGRDPYWTTPGGRVEDDDPDVVAALRRELWEELGATVGRLHNVFTFVEHRPHANYRHHFFLCRLESMDLAQRCGPEFADPGRGRYDVDRFPCAEEAFAELALWPHELRDFLAGHASGLRGLI